MESTTRDGGGLSGGELNAAIADAISELVADHTGRQATTSRAFVEHDLVVCKLEGAATNADRHLVAAGEEELVRRQRDVLQHAMEQGLVAAVERLTGRTVRTSMGGMLGESWVEVFELDPDRISPQPDAED
jgi:uncharacterized protein YbcI